MTLLFTSLEEGEYEDALLTCAYTIQILAGLSFIGLGIEPPNPEWGTKIKTGAALIVQGHW